MQCLRSGGCAIQKHGLKYERLISFIYPALNPFQGRKGWSQSQQALGDGGVTDWTVFQSNRGLDARLGILYKFKFGLKGLIFRPLS